jgi:hypothetical protein
LEFEKNYETTKPAKTVIQYSYLSDEQRAICKRLHPLVIERVEDPLVLGPGDELVGRVGFDVAVDDPGEVERQVLDRGRKGHPSWIYKKKGLKTLTNVPSRQCCGSTRNRIRVRIGSGFNGVPGSVSGSGSRRVKMTQNIGKS